MFGRALEIKTYPALSILTILSGIITTCAQVSPDSALLSTVN